MTTKKNILYLVHRVPYPPDKGDRIRTFNLLRFLARRANVYVACLADEPVSQDTVATIQELTANLAIVPIGRWSRCVRALASAASGRTVSEGAFSSPGLQDVVRRWSGEFRFHAVLASSSSMVPYLRIPELADVPAVVDLIDVDSQKWLDYAASSRWPRAWLYRMEGRRLRQLERGLPEWAQAVTLVSDAEVDLYREFCLPGQIRAVPNGV
ncbi:MAG: sugar transferase, partial [Planctomycetes bacterium]|nr:sugar transferase [Planctomycetota bacterium]